MEKFKEARETDNQKLQKKLKKSSVEYVTTHPMHSKNRLKRKLKKKMR